MPPRIDTRNTYYLRNVQTQQHLHISDSIVTSGRKVENPSHQVSIESVADNLLMLNLQWKFIPAGSTSADYFIQNVGNSEYLGLHGTRTPHYNGYYAVSTSKFRLNCCWKVSWHSTAIKME